MVSDLSGQLKQSRMRLQRFKEERVRLEGGERQDENWYSIEPESRFNRHSS